jgi:hypothetical protein
VADKGYQGAGPAVQVPQRRRRLDRDTGRYRRSSQNQKTATPPTPASAARRARQRPPEELDCPSRIRSCPTRATKLVNAVQVVILAG